MTAPLATTTVLEDEAPIKRLSDKTENLGERFILSKKAYTAQYAQLYFTRLMQISPVIRSRVKKEWPAAKHVKLLCLEDGKDLVVSGTLYKNMKLRPTALMEYTQDKTIAQQLNAEDFCDDDDNLVLEDESARVSLAGTHLNVAHLVSGMIIAVRGTFDTDSGVFTVTHHMFAGMPQQVPRPVIAIDKYIMIASGLTMGDASKGDSQRIGLLLDWLRGMLGEEDLCSRITRLVIAGGTFSDIDSLATASSASKQQRFAMQGVHDMDQFITQLASALPVDLMPGPGDLSNFAMPQQPFHRCLFPGAAPYQSFQRVTNPYNFSVDGIRMLGTSGQNVADIRRYVRDSDVLDVMQENLIQRHICPTAPDTLSCYPFVDNDPFVVDNAPHLYFTGNQKAFAQRKISGEDGQDITLLSVPSFAQTGLVVLVNLSNLECQSVKFDAML